MIRRAVVSDVPAFAKIINDCAEYGLMLHRSMAFLYEHVRDFFVSVAPDDPAKIQGVCGLSVVWANLAEVYSLAVAPEFRRQGLGRQLVESCVEEARLLGIRKLMALTYEKPFFESLGFSVVDRQQLPLKVWSECMRCPKNQACDEIAMIRVLPEIPEQFAPQAPPPALDAYIVPVVLRNSGKSPLSS
ncbi:MAG: N-acetyltransferase [Phycisphaeraceae bacterium]|nr:N-acetyltransferase [Phycisphaeraceae bacterium]